MQKKIKMFKHKKQKKIIVTGIYKANQKGYGFVIPFDTTVPDVFIPPFKNFTAMDGDTVIVHAEKTNKTTGKEQLFRGKVIEIKERSQRKIIGTLIREQKKIYLIPDNTKINLKIQISQNKHSQYPKFELTKGLKASVLITAYPKNNEPAKGTISRILGNESDPKIDTKIILEEYNLSSEFPEKVINELADVSTELSAQDIKERLDLRNKTTVTIDPFDAKDFDDAISLEKKRDQSWRLYVHIADVSHYIAYDSNLDIEAKKRSTSVYLPDMVIPMLPEKLSNNICSLKEGVARLTKTAIIDISNEGAVLNYQIKKTIINSDKRLTYETVLKFLEGDQTIITERKIKILVHHMAELGTILKKMRQKRGCLYLDLPEAKIIIDKNGNPQEIKKEQSDISHSIIEEFMLTANETIAAHLRKNLKKKDITSIYRIHEEPNPEKLEEFKNFLSYFNFNNAVISSSKSIQKILSHFEGKPESYIVNLALLKSLQQAVYSSSNPGHFALSAKDYTHFTSPIRRYADLIIHRLLDCLEDKTIPFPEEYRIKEKIDETISHINSMEKNAKEAEFQCKDVKMVRFLMNEKFKNKIWEALIVSVHSYGFFVQLRENLIEGLVHNNSFEHDFFRFDEKKKAIVGHQSKQSFKIGDIINLRVFKLDLAKAQIDFQVVV